MSNQSHQVRLLGLRGRICAARLLCFVISTLFAAEGLGQGSIDSLITRSIRGADILRVNTQMELPPSRTFGVAHITIANAKRPSPADRNLTVVLYARSWGGGPGNEGFAYSKSIQLPEGATTVSVDIPFVYQGVQSAWDVGVFEAGRDIEDKRNQPRNTVPFMLVYQDNEQSAFASIQGTNEAAASVNKNLDVLVGTQPIQQTQNRSTRTVVERSHVVPIKDASSDWRVYFPYQAWVISSETMDEIIDSRPEVARVLRHYVACGGTLLVHSAELPEERARVDQLLESEADSDAWELDTYFEKGSAEEGEKFGSAEYAQRAYLGGSVILLGTALDEVDSKFYDRRLRSLANIYSNLNSTNSMDGNWFWKNLIRAVGKPPVWTFCVIVVLFGLLLGPGLLFFTGRVRRRSLMILLVPSIALVATLAIISYGVLHEGFETHIRITSVTRLDQSSGKGFAWSRQNYFSGLPPREGLVFSLNTYARPVQADDDQRYRSTEPRRDVDCRVSLTDRQTWRGWLKPRQQQQLIVGHPVEQMTAPVELAAAEDGQLQVINRSEHELPFVIVRGADDDYFFHGPLSAGESTTIQSAPREETAADVAQAMVDLRPMPPPELQDGGSLLSFGMSRRRSRGFIGYEAKDDVINQVLATHLSDKLNMEPFTYTTILPSNSAIEVPLEGTEEDGMHIVVGGAKW